MRKTVITAAMDVPMYSDNEMRKAIAKAVADEREAIAKLAEQEAERMEVSNEFDYLPIAAATLRDFVELIRARTTPHQILEKADR